MVKGDFWKEVSKFWVTKNDGTSGPVREAVQNITEESEAASNKLMYDMNKDNDDDFSDL